MTDYASVYEKASANGYRNTDELPDRPTTPSLLRKQAKDLTPAEIESLPAIHAAHAKAVADYEAAIKAWRKKDAELGASFEEELAREFAVLDNPKRTMLFDKAWSRGRDNGHCEVALIYGELVDLIKQG